MPDFTLHAPGSLQEACMILGSYDGDARVIAGGTALVLMVRQGLLAPRALVRLDRVPGLDGIAVEDGMLRLGATATLRAVSESRVVRAHLPVLAATCQLVGNVRVRNAATVGGNVCEADYASDPPGLLVALDATARIQGPAGSREVPVRDLITDFYETSLAPNEVVTDVRVPLLQPGARAVYLKYVTRSSEDRPCVGATAVARLDDGGILADVRVAVGAVSGRPLRLPEVETAVRGQRPTTELFREVAARYAEASDPVSDARGSAGYRKQMVAVFVRRALQEAIEGTAVARKY